MARVSKPYASFLFVMPDTLPRISRRSRDELAPLARDDAGIDPAPGPRAREPAEFDLHASLHHDLEAGSLGLGGGFLVADPELHPYALGADRDRVVDDRRYHVRFPEDVDDVDFDGDVLEI